MGKDIIGLRSDDLETLLPCPRLFSAHSKVLEAPIKDTSFQVFNVGGEENNATKQMIVNSNIEVFQMGRLNM